MTVLVLLVPAWAAAQGVTGMADWSYARNTTSAEGSGSTTDSFTQAYTAGYRSILWDRRFMQYEGEATFRKIGMNWNDQHGRSSDVGYRFGATLFGSRSFPLVVSALRSFGLESGNLPSGNTLRGGLVLPAGQALPELNTRTSNANVLWQLDTPRLPRVEIAYHRNNSSISAAGETVTQRDRALSVVATRKTGPLSNELRFQKTSLENQFSLDFTQRVSEFAYDGNAALGRRVRTTTRLGYRKLFSLFDVPLRITDFGQEAFGAPSRGESTIRYAIQSVSWQATSRLSTDVTVSYDTSSSDDISTHSLLASGLVRYLIVKGLTVDATGTNGTRTQVVRGTSLDAVTRSATAGVSYASRVPHLQFGGSAHEGRGRATSIDGQTGNSTLWNRQATVSTDVLRWVELGALYEKGRTTDDLFVFGNYALERRRLTARTQIGTRGSLQADWEHAKQERGRAPELYLSDLVTQSAGANYLLARNHRLTFAAGKFRNAYQSEADTVRFADVNYDGQLTPRLRLNATFREEISRRRTLDQDGYIAIGLLEYRVRLFMFGLEQRLTNIDYRVPNRDPFLYHGNSLLVRINRRFGWMF